MDGILNILKPPGMTSFDVVALVRGLTGIRRTGHAGTLDPMAAGVLPVCVGRAAKAVEFLMEKGQALQGRADPGHNHGHTGYHWRGACQTKTGPVGF